MPHAVDASSWLQEEIHQPDELFSSLGFSTPEGVQAILPFTFVYTYDRFCLVEGCVCLRTKDHHEDSLLATLALKAAAALALSSGLEVLLCKSHVESFIVFV